MSAFSSESCPLLHEPARQSALSSARPPAPAVAPLLLSESENLQPEPETREGGPGWTAEAEKRGTPALKTQGLSQLGGGGRGSEDDGKAVSRICFGESFLLWLKSV